MYCSRRPRVRLCRAPRCLLLTWWVNKSHVVSILQVTPLHQHHGNLLGSFVKLDTGQRVGYGALHITRACSKSHPEGSKETPWATPSSCAHSTCPGMQPAPLKETTGSLHYTWIFRSKGDRKDTGWGTNRHCYGGQTSQVQKMQKKWPAASHHTKGSCKDHNY